MYQQFLDMLSNDSIVTQTTIDAHGTATNQHVVDTYPTTIKSYTEFDDSLISRVVLRIEEATGDDPYIIDLFQYNAGHTRWDVFSTNRVIRVHLTSPGDDRHEGRLFYVDDRTKEERSIEILPTLAEVIFFLQKELSLIS